jgi:hypothetical protein
MLLLFPIYKQVNFRFNVKFSISIGKPFISHYGYFDDELVGRSMPDDWNLNLDDSDLFSRASIRDPEFIEQYPSLWGYQSVSGKFPYP